MDRGTDFQHKPIAKIKREKSIFTHPFGRLVFFILFSSSRSDWTSISMLPFNVVPLRLVSHQIITSNGYHDLQSKLRSSSIAEFVAAHFREQSIHWWMSIFYRQCLMYSYLVVSRPRCIGWRIFEKAIGKRSRTISGIEFEDVECS